MRALRTILFVAGSLILILLVVRLGAGDIVSSLAQVAWWQFALICLVYGLSVGVDTVGWRYAFPRDRVPLHRLLAARAAGEAVNVVTALGSVGGEPVKAWLLRRDVPYEESVPSVIIAKTAIIVAQALLLLLGIVVVWTSMLDSPLVTAMLWLLLIEVGAIGGFLAAQVTGLIGKAGRLLSAFGIVEDASHIRRLDDTLRQFYRWKWRRFLLSVGLHLIGWFCVILETVLTLSILGVPASLSAATVIEALGSAVRFATFLVPASVGALEGANAAGFAALGLGATAGLVFSLVRRGRQAVWIGVGILALVAMRASAGAPTEAVEAAPRRAQ